LKYLAILAILAALLVSCGTPQARLVGTEGSVLVAHDPSTYQQIGKLDTSTDGGKAELRRLLETGALYMVTSGTHVRVIETNDAYSQIEITEGDHSGATGYVHPDDIQE
jgi:hypothetical protein